MNLYPKSWLPPHTPMTIMDQKYAAVANRHDIAEEAVQRLVRYIALPKKPLGPDFVPAMLAWIDVLSEPRDPRYGVLIWFILNSQKNSGPEPWVWALNYANGRFRI